MAVYQPLGSPVDLVTIDSIVQPETQRRTPWFAKTLEQERIVIYERHDFQRIQHIKTYYEGIAETVVRFGNDYNIFESDKDFINSVSMSMMQIGELSVGLSDAFKDATRHKIQWGALKGMRNLFVHAYISMNKSVIWESATRDVPAVLDFCTKIIEQNEEAMNQKQDMGIKME